MPDLTWLTREAFDQRNAALRFDREWQSILFDIASLDIYGAIPVAPTTDPDDGDYPSSLHRWYGEIDDRLFVIDIYHDATPDKCCIVIPYSLTHTFAWQTLVDLEELPDAVWLGGTIGIDNDSPWRILSVFREDERGFKFPVYNGASEEDAKTLLQYLQELGPDAKYSLGLPPPNISWVVKEIVAGNEVERACYDSASALNSACKMSLDSDREFRVYSLAPEIDCRRYTIRDGIVIHETGATDRRR